MIRQLFALTAGDARRELEGYGITPSESDVNDLRTNLTFAIDGYQHNDITAVFEKIGLSDRVRLLGETTNDKKARLIACFTGASPLQLASLLGENPSKDLHPFTEELKNVLDNVAIEKWDYVANGRSIPLHQPLIMGVLNMTPDSFSDGGQYLSADAAHRRALEMLANGADIIDIGGESSRPGADPVDAAEEWRRIGAVVERLAKETDAVLSVDTYKSETARRALDVGAHIINDISGLTFDEKMAGVVAEFGVPLMLMHIQRKPKTMQEKPEYGMLIYEIYRWLRNQCRTAEAQGVHQLIIDPGIGFGKRLDDNFEIIRRLNEFRSLGYPLLIGTSRKTFLRELLQTSASDSVIGTVTSSLLALQNGAKIIRVHDVKEMKQCLQVLKAVREHKA